MNGDIKENMWVSLGFKKTKTKVLRIAKDGEKINRKICQIF
jgi:hypothetical protein